MACPAFATCGASASGEARLQVWHGGDAPTFVVDDLSGQPARLAAEQHPVTIVHFFATWCESWRDEPPALEPLVARTGTSGLRVLALAVAEPKARVKSLLARHPSNFPVLLDRDRSIAKAGKCADIYALYVGLARAAGLPARDVYGIRVAPSRFGYKSLGAGSEVITKARHCRAEVYLSGLGWIPVDPADVRKVVLEEPPANLPLADPKVTDARATLFGAWEGSWLAYNFAHDVVLPSSRGPAVDFLMYPQAETVAGRLDCLDPDGFRYGITARQLDV